MKMMDMTKFEFEGVRENEEGLDLMIKVFEKDKWLGEKFDTSYVNSMRLPGAISSHIANYRVIYNRRHANRNLTWQFKQGNFHV